MKIKVALAGNPNSGKTTLFNSLTGSNQYVGNWPGVTVEKKSGKLKGNKEIEVVDLPGIYSLSPYTLEEVVTRDFLADEKPDLIVNIVDASNIERNLYLTTQLMEFNIPVIIALNMMDIIQKNGDQIQIDKLQGLLGCPIVEISALKNIGLDKVIDLIQSFQTSPWQYNSSIDLYDTAVKEVLDQIRESVIKINALASQPFYQIKLFERDEKIQRKLSLPQDISQEIEAKILKVEIDLEDDSESLITSQRYQFISEIVGQTVRKKQTGLTTSDKIDRIVTNRWLALPIFAVIMWVVYFVSVSSLGTLLTDWTNDVLFGDIVTNGLQGFLQNIGAAPWLISLLVDGIVGGVGAVLGFVPQMFILFFFLSILEDCGYMARVAFIMDRIFRRLGLSGKSFIPLLVSSGCAVPGVMASRTIENEKDRRMTIIVTSFVPCGAKLPVIAMIGGAFFGGASWVAPSVYFMGILMVIVSGVMLKKTKLFSGDPAPFVMELPQYHMPAFKGVLKHMWERVRSFIIKAGTIIFLASAAIWFLLSFNFSLQMVEVQDSIMFSLGNLIAPIFAPLGFGRWEAAVATITGLLAKETVVSTFGIIFGLGEEVVEDNAGLWQQLPTLFGSVAAYSFLAFNMICAPCVAAIGAIRREMKSAFWTWFAIIYQTLLAYTISLIMYQIGGLFLGQTSFGIATVVAIGLLALILIQLFRPTPKNSAPALK